MKEDKGDIKRDKDRGFEQGKKMRKRRWKSNQKVYDLEISKTLLRKQAEWDKVGGCV